MKRSTLALAFALVIMLSGCDGTMQSGGVQIVADATSTTEVGLATPAIPPTSTPTEAPTPTETPTPTPTPDPIEPFLGAWVCDGCVTMERLEFTDTGSGLQLHTWWTGSAHDWIGSERCESVFLPYYDCSVNAGSPGALSVHYVMHNPYFTDPDCRQVVDLGFQLQDGVIMLTRWDASIMICEEGGPNPVGTINEWSVMEGRPWPGWHKVE